MNLSAGILTYRSPVTLKNTLLSYKANGLLEIIEDIFCIIQPSEKAEEEIAVCKDFNVRSILMESNGKMAWGVKRVFEEAKHENVLFLECDFRCLESRNTVKELLTQCIHFLETKAANVVRLRSLKNPGHPIQAILLKGNEFRNFETVRQLYLCTHYLEDPHRIFPEHVQLVQEAPRIYKMSSKNCCYTNNPTITTKAFYTKNILPYIHFGGHLEPEIGDDWADRNNHTILITAGLFTHIRMDGHEGLNCHCCPRKYGGVSDISNCCCCKGELFYPPPFVSNNLTV
jgi:hypothetical protein